MPVRLPGGHLIYNVTPHKLDFWCGTEHGVITVPSDEVINAQPVIKLVKDCGSYWLTTVDYTTLVEGLVTIENIKTHHPEALIVGSVICAQGYRELIVAPVPLRRTRGIAGKESRRYRSDRFTTFFKENKS